MTTQATWQVRDMTRMDADGGVILVLWHCNTTTSEGTENSLSRGKQQVTYDPSSPTFTPYADLTEAQVLGWVWDSVDKDAIETAGRENVEAQIVKNTTTEQGVPWATAPEEI